MASPIPFNSRNLSFFLQDASGKLSVRVGPGPGDGSIPEMAEGGKATINIYGEGDFLGRIYGQELEGEVTVTVHLKRGALAQDELLNAVFHRGTWADATTCDPGGEVWAPSLLVVGNTAEGVWAVRWPSCRPRVTMSRTLEGSTCSLTANVAGQPTIGDAALAWPT